MMQGDYTSINYFSNSSQSIEEQYWQIYYRLYMESLMLQATKAFQPLWFNLYPNQSMAYSNELQASYPQSQELDLSKNNTKKNFNLYLTKESNEVNVPEEEEEKSEELPIETNYLQKKTKRSTKICTDCPHHLARHYAKGMCSNCYHSKGRNKKPWKCAHSNKSHYALGLCQNCYQMNYTKSRKDTSSTNYNSQDM